MNSTEKELKMIVKSATGDVDLSQPENVRRGLELVGCDPSVADRADCERFGLAPGVDAGYFGFARTRDGFAVDLRRVGLPVGSIVLRASETERRVVMSEAPPKLWHLEAFIGLDSRHARPEDVERLCCGERETADRWDPETGTYQPARWLCCTLAIAHDGDHENIAAGVKWKAESGPTWTLAAAGYETTVRGYKVAVKPAGGSWSYEVSDWAGAIRGQRATEQEAKARALAAVPEQASRPMNFYSVNSPEDADRLFGNGSEMAGKTRGALVATWSVVGDASLTRTTLSLALANANAFDHAVNLTPLAAALRASLATVDTLTWSAANKRALRDAAHAVCEVVEATDGKAPSALAGPVREALAALAAAAHVGPTVIGEAERARDAARAAMPRRAK